MVAGIAAICGGITAAFVL